MWWAQQGAAGLPRSTRARRRVPAAHCVSPDGRVPDPCPEKTALRLEGVVRRSGTVTAPDHFTLRVARGEVVGHLRAERSGGGVGGTRAAQVVDP